MPTTTLTDPTPQGTATGKNHALHVKDVPYAIWCRVRHNANLSRMTVREYVIRALAEAPTYSPSVHSTELTAQDLRSADVQSPGNGGSGSPLHS